jgi:HlyD family secretion protein
MKMSKKKFIFWTMILGSVLYFLIEFSFHKEPEAELILTELSTLRSYDIEVHTIGELEAMHSTTIASAIKGDLGKIIYLVSDGASVNANDTLIRMDPTPFEEQIEELKRQIQEQHSKVNTLERIFLWETSQVEHEKTAAKIEIEVAKLEINKMIHGDGPIEETRLKSALQKSFAKYNELKSFANDLVELQAQDFFNPIELKQAQNKLEEEKELYESAKMQYESFVNHTQPMQIKKAEIALKRCENKYEEVLKSSAFKIAKAQSQLDQSIQELNDCENQLKNAEHQMMLTEIKAPNPGMVVFKEEFRNGQRRKPRLGDIVLKNQPLLDLPDLGIMLVKTKAREIDLFKIKIGTPGIVEIDAYPELRLKGKILSIGVLASSDTAKTGDEKYFDLIVKLDSNDSRLRPGMTARVILLSNRVENKCSIPIQAVFEFHKQCYCFIKKGYGCVVVPIKTGLSNEQWVEIRSGLKENLPVLLSMPGWSSVENASEVLGKKK